MSKNFELLTQLGENIGVEMPAAETPSARVAVEAPSAPAPELPVAEPRRTREFPSPAPPKSSSYIRLGGRVVTATQEEIQLVQQVFMLPGEDAPQSVVFCGVDNRDGSDLICARAAEILATRMTGAVCVLDTDLDSPSMHSLYGLENETGLSDAALQGGGVSRFARQIEGSNLWLVPAGTRVGGKRIIISSDRLQALLDELRQEFEHVLISAAPANRRPDAVLLGQLTNGVILVLTAGSTRRATAVKVRDKFAASNVNILGAVLGGREYPIPDSLYRKL
jgi:protein-tyrosine kinase